MRPIQLTLKGFKGIRAGLGRDEITIDLSKSSGLIAITGPNGAGKTTILDNLHPFRLMPWKIKGDFASPDAFSFYDQCFGDAVKDLIWEFEGVLYRTTILINAERRTQQCFLAVAVPPDANEWRPFNAECATGKTGAYDEAVESILGTPKTFFTSVFRAQGAKALSDYSRGDVMGIFSEILRLDEIVALGVKANEIAKALNNEADKGTAELAGLERQSADADAAKAAITELTEQILLSGARAAGFEEELTRLDLTRREYESQVSNHEANGVTHREVQADHATKKSIWEVAGVAAYQTKTRNDASIDKAKCLVAEANDSITSAKLVIAISPSEEQIKGAVARLTELDTMSRLADEIGENLQAEGLRVNNLREQVNEAKARRDRVKSAHDLKRQPFRHDARACQMQIDQATETASLLSTLDCAGRGDSWINNACPLLERAIAARDSIPALQKAKREAEFEIAMLDQSEKDDFAAVNAEIAALGDWVAPANALQEGIRENKALKMQIADEVKATKVISDQQVKVVEAQSKLDAANRALEVATTSLNDAEATAARECREAEENLATALAALQDATKKVDAALSAVTASGSADTNLRQTLTRIDAKKLDLADAQKEVLEAEKKKAAHQAIVDAAQQIMDGLIAGRRFVANLRKQVSLWLIVAKGLSNRGVVALEIEDAGPSISTLANHLLTSCYGDRFAVRLKTQEEKRDGSGMKEVFDIEVFDSQTNEKVSLTEKSGGETTYVEDALTRALCLHAIETSGKRFEALFSDEHDGALDAERKVNFLKIKREAMKQGSHNMEIFISQTPDLIAMADVRIVLDRAGVSIG